MNVHQKHDTAAKLQGDFVHPCTVHNKARGAYQCTVFVVCSEIGRRAELLSCWAAVHR